MILLNTGVESKVSVDQYIENLGLYIILIIIMMSSNDSISPLLVGFH